MGTPRIDPLSDLLGHISLRARVFKSGELCRNACFDGDDRVGHLHVLRKGNMTVINGTNERQELREPHLLFYSRPQRHTLAVDAAAPPDVVCASVEFSGGAANPVSSTLPAYLALPLRRLSGLSGILDCLFDEGLHPRDGGRAVLDRLCEVLVVQLLRLAIADETIKQGVVAGLMDKRVAPALAAIHADPRHAWGLDELADLCNVSRSRFAVRFKAKVGLTVGDYLASWRVFVAQELLRSGKPVTLVADEVGYGSQSALSRAFARETGMSPREWARQAV